MGEDQLNELVAWLVGQGYPFNWHTVEPAPRWLRQPLAEAWAKQDNEPVENYLWALDVEQVWAT